MKKTTPATHIVPETAHKERLDVFLAGVLGITRSQAQKIINAGLVQVNEETPQKTGLSLSTDDKVTIAKETVGTIAEEQKKHDAEEILRMAAKPLPPFKILAETPDYLVVEKPAGMLTHSTSREEHDSLAELLLKKYPELRNIGDDPQRPGIVHRLDKEASGLLVVARTEDMFAALKKQFKLRQIEKEYMALAHGRIAKDTDIIDFPIKRSRQGERMSAIPKTGSDEQLAKAKSAETEFNVEKRFVNFTLLRVQIHSGRMHQIRTHLLAYNHPLVGDPLYLHKKQKRTWDDRLGRMFLHAAHLVFTDLHGNRQEFSSPLPKQLEHFLSTLA